METWFATAATGNELISKSLCGKELFFTPWKPYTGDEGMVVYVVFWW